MTLQPLSCFKAYDVRGQLLRLNVESRGDVTLMQAKTAQLATMIHQLPN